MILLLLPTARGPRQMALSKAAAPHGPFSRVRIGVLVYLTGARSLSEAA